MKNYIPVCCSRRNCWDFLGKLCDWHISPYWEKRPQPSVWNGKYFQHLLRKNTTTELGFSHCVSWNQLIPTVSGNPNFPWPFVLFFINFHFQFSIFSDGFKCALPFLLASMVKHQKWMRGQHQLPSGESFPSNHSIFNSKLWLFNQELLTTLEAQLISGKIAICEISGMRATDIPPIFNVCNNLMYCEIL